VRGSVSKRPFEQLGYRIQSVSLGASRRIYRVADAKFQVMFEYIFFMVFFVGKFIHSFRVISSFSTAISLYTINHNDFSRNTVALQTLR
jgi:hypothetical protein